MPRLGLSDDGTTVNLEVGGNASIALAGGLAWGEPAVTGPAVTLSEDISDAETSGRSWTVVAREPGEASVTVTGSPACRSETPPCEAPDRSWSVRFVVE